LLRIPIYIPIYYSNELWRIFSHVLSVTGEAISVSGGVNADMHY